jgi:hypothetical protein
MIAVAEDGFAFSTWLTYGHWSFLYSQIDQPDVISDILLETGMYVSFDAVVHKSDDGPTLHFSMQFTDHMDLWKPEMSIGTQIDHGDDKGGLHEAQICFVDTIANIATLLEKLDGHFDADDLPPTPQLEDVTVTHEQVDYSKKEGLDGKGIQLSAYGKADSWNFDFSKGEPESFNSGTLVHKVDNLKVEYGLSHNCKDSAWVSFNASGSNTDSLDWGALGGTVNFTNIATPLDRTISEANLKAKYCAAVEDQYEGKDGKFVGSHVKLSVKDITEHLDKVEKYIDDANLEEFGTNDFAQNGRRLKGVEAKEASISIALLTLKKLHSAQELFKVYKQEKQRLVRTAFVEYSVAAVLALTLLFSTGAVLRHSLRTHKWDAVAVHEEALASAGGAAVETTPPSMPC